MSRSGLLPVALTAVLSAIDAPITQAFAKLYHENLPLTLAPHGELIEFVGSLRRTARLTQPCAM
jgi:hypothetical protein